MFNSRAFRAAALIVGALMSFSATAQSPSDAAAKPAKADPAAPLFAIYLVTGQPNAIEAMNVPLESLQLAPEPIVMERDLISFDRATMRFVFKPGVVGRFPQHPNVRGVPFVVVARGERIYAGAFWTMASSYLCEAPHLSFPYVTIENDGTTRPDTVVLENTTVDRPGVPDKPDPRLDPRILEALTRARVLAPRPGRFAGNDESTSPPLEALVPGAPLWPGFAIYLTAGGTTAHDFDKNKTPLADLPLAAKPLFTEADIAGYDWALHIVHLKPGNLERLPPPRTVWGKPFVVVAGGERIYMGGLWTSLSSQSASFPVIDMSPFPVFPSSLEGGKGPVKPPDAFWIGPGYPGAMKDAPDPRNDPRIRVALEKAGVLRESGPPAPQDPAGALWPGFAVYLSTRTFPTGQKSPTQDLEKLPLDPKPLLTDRDLVAYDWRRHALVLRPQAVTEIASPRTGRLTEWQRKHRDVAILVIVAGGERIYSLGQPHDSVDMPGRLNLAATYWFPLDSTRNLPAGSIPQPIPASAGELRIERAPSGSDPDPRSDPRIRAALEKAGVLKNSETAAAPPEFTKPLWPGFAIYATDGNATALESSRTDLKDLPLAADPLLTEADIDAYDWDLQEVRTKFGRMINQFPNNEALRGRPFVVVAGGERIYMGGFWTNDMTPSADFPVILGSAIIPPPFEGGRRMIVPAFRFRIEPGLPLKKESELLMNPKVHNE